MIVLLYILVLVFFFIILKNKLLTTKENFQQQCFDYDTYISSNTLQVVDSSYQVFMNQRRNEGANKDDDEDEDDEPLLNTNKEDNTDTQLERTSSSIQEQANSIPEPNIRGITPEEERRLIQNQINEERRIQDQQERLTIATEPDDMCCGVNIYPIELQNINKCIVQHIQRGDPLSPTYNEWKEIDEEINTCRNPHSILCRTSNCSNIIQKYRPNIDSILNVANDNSRVGCPYRASIDNEPIQGSGLTPREMLTIFRNRVECDESEQEQEVPFSNTEFNIIRCN